MFIETIDVNASIKIKYKIQITISRHDQRGGNQCSDDYPEFKRRMEVVNHK
jgi:hypothetical protein